MDAKIITYTTNKLTQTQKSIISKKINGYLDKSNKGRYRYNRQGLLSNIKHIKITNKTFIIEKKHFEKIKKEIEKLGAKVISWDIKIKKI